MKTSAERPSCERRAAGQTRLVGDGGGGGVGGLWAAGGFHSIRMKNVTFRLIAPRWQPTSPARTGTGGPRGRTHPGAILGPGAGPCAGCGSVYLARPRASSGPAPLRPQAWPKRNPSVTDCDDREVSPVPGARHNGGLLFVQATPSPFPPLGVHRGACPCGTLSERVRPHGRHTDRISPVSESQ